ncbi:hypothetical protein bcgnr5372_33450 [Bacillus luti]
MLSETIAKANKVLKLTITLPPLSYIKFPIVHFIMIEGRKDYYTPMQLSNIIESNVL